MSLARVLRGSAVLLLAGLAIWQVWSKGLLSSESVTEPLKPGSEVPAIEVIALEDGQIVDLASLATGECSLLYFFDPSCPACQLALDDWTGRTNELARLDVRWVSLSSSRDSTLRFLRHGRIDLPAFQVRNVDEGGLGHLGIGAIPGVWAIEKDTIRAVRTGRSRTGPEALATDLSWCSPSPRSS